MSIHYHQLEMNLEENCILNSNHDVYQQNKNNQFSNAFFERATQMNSALRTQAEGVC